MTGHFAPSLDDTLVAEACRHTHPFWGRGRTLEQHTERAFRQLQTAGPELLRYVGWVGEDGTLLSSLKRYSVLLSVPAAGGSRQVRTVGIGSVFTAEPHRGKGAASRLLQAVLDEARALGEEAALLYSDIAPGFYARLGFVEYPALEYSAPIGLLPAQGTLDVRLATSDDAGLMLGWYEASYPADFLRPARDEALWRYFCAHNPAGRDLVLLEGNRATGYLKVTEIGTTLRVEEWAAPGIPPERVWATLRLLADEAGADRLTGWLRPDQVDPRFIPSPRDWAIPMVADLTGALTLTEIDPARTHFSHVDHF